MDITYIAKHDTPHSNDEEGAITYALEYLGHKVTKIQEQGIGDNPEIKGDLLLFHKWCDPQTLANLKGKITRAFWYFDLVDFPDDTLASRNRTRRNWMAVTLPHIDIGFCTDGDWVARHPEKLRVLHQGADSRVATQRYPKANRADTILFTGISTKGGSGRESFVNEMLYTYGSRFLHYPRRRHGGSLAQAIADAQIVVAPDAPCTDNYWSNRVYLSLGYGAFLLHPYCRGLSKEYGDGEEIAWYHSRDELHHLIRHYSLREEERARIAYNGFRRTLKDHTYIKRCESLLSQVREVAPWLK